ncbi:signal recognition particle-docking protein FtsY [Helicovermis profundi]|uniref:Signal recognition particle receptor FtsY n=1 Tax=Helicovermis profundi TaxID=3065157 RepID=A0AAU9EIK0_9FIRM|nr:signal recognition particle-docking protein FtsY [Clostridia bacterium S502]
MFKKLFGKGKKETVEVVEEIAKEDIDTSDANDEDNDITDIENSIEEKKSEEDELMIVDNKNQESYNDFDTTSDISMERGDFVEESSNGDDIENSKKIGFFARLKNGLVKTSKVINDRIDDLFNNYGEIDDDLFEELEEILIMADIGMSTTMEIIEELQNELKKQKIKDSSKVKDVLKEVLVNILSENNNRELISSVPAIILVIGVNGAGKTTTIGKIANKFKSEGKSVLLAAGDTFRAAAIDQLEVWGKRANVNVIAHQEGSDPAAVIYDAIQSARAKNIDVLICDTAGRLHNKKNLMNELTKVFKIVDREYPQADKEVLLVLDATTGQNAIQQAKLFKEAAAISGIVLTKLDGTAKGGVILGINSELNIPVKLIGVGEGVDDLQKFNAKTFVDALFG